MFGLTARVMCMPLRVKFIGHCGHVAPDVQEFINCMFTMIINADFILFVVYLPDFHVLIFRFLVNIYVLVMAHDVNVAVSF